MKKALSVARSAKENFSDKIFEYGLSLASFESIEGTYAIPDPHSVESEKNYIYRNITQYYFTYTIYGKNVGFNSYLSNDATNVEKLLCLFTDVQLINTLLDETVLPSSYVKTIIDSPEIGEKGVFWINLDEFMYWNDAYAGWAGYYTPETNQITIPLSFILSPNHKKEKDYDPTYNERYIRSAEDLRSLFIHELAHAFDDAIGEGQGSFLHGSNSYLLSDPNSTWAQLYYEFKDLLWNVQVNQHSGYSNFDELDPKVRFEEFFAEAVRAYFENPEGLKNLGNGELYREIDAIMKAYGGK